MKHMVKLGDIIGMIVKFIEPQKYELREAKVTSIRITKQGTKIYAPKCFHPIFLDEIECNTNLMNENKDIVLVHEPVLLNDEIRERMQRWCEFATEHYDKFDDWRHKHI